VVWQGSAGDRRPYADQTRLRLWISIRHGCRRRDSEGACGLGRGTRQQRLHRRHRKQPFLQARSRWRYQHGHGRTSLAHLPRVRHFRRSLYIAEATAYRLSGITAVCTTIALRRRGFQFQRRVSGPMPHALDEPELRCLEHIFRRAVPGVARNAEGTICFSDPQHIEVWRLPAAPPPSRGRLQFRFISADYPTAGQKRRLTTRHRQ
jgi:hypothetical protein